MSIHEIVWSEDRIEHIARHNVSPEDVEEVYFSRSFVAESVSRKGKTPVYYVLGQTPSGRYLFCVIIRFSGGIKIAHHRTSNDRQRKI